MPCIFGPAHDLGVPDRHVASGMATWPARHQFRAGFDEQSHRCGHSLSFLDLGRGINLALANTRPGHEATPMVPRAAQSHAVDVVRARRRLRSRTRKRAVPVISIFGRNAPSPTSSPVVETASDASSFFTSMRSRLQAFLRASTAGANRFIHRASPKLRRFREASSMPAARRRPPPSQRPELATVWGRCPYMAAVGEDCLTLHVGRPLSNTSKQSVCWLHVGAFSPYGCRPTSPRYDSTNSPFAATSWSSAVKPSTTVFGHLDLSQSGERFAIRQCVFSSGARARMVRVGTPPLSRRSGQRHHLRPVRRRRKGERPAGLAEAKASSQGHHQSRRQRAALPNASARRASPRCADISLGSGTRRAAGAAAGAPVRSGRAGLGRRFRVRAICCFDRYNLGP